MSNSSFNSPLGNPVFYRTYSRRLEDKSRRESWLEAVDRAQAGLAKLAKLSDEEAKLLKDLHISKKCLPSGRWMWVGGTSWLEDPNNFYGAYNCFSTVIVDWEDFAITMDLLMQGVGAGAVVELKNIELLPTIERKVNVTIIRLPGTYNPRKTENSLVQIGDNKFKLEIGDTRRCWAEGVKQLLELTSTPYLPEEIDLEVDLGNVRPAGSLIKGFGGVTNPDKLPYLYQRIAEITNRRVGAKLTSVDCCKVLGAEGITVVSGNVRRSAEIHQGSETDVEFANAKQNLWVQDPETGKWKIDPERDELRMANHTRVFHYKPSYEVIKDAVTKQYYSGEGAIQYAPEAVARANADLLNTTELKQQFLELYNNVHTPDSKQGYEELQKFLIGLDPTLSSRELEHRLTRYGLNPCAEIVMRDNLCNLSEIHLNLLDPFDLKEQRLAFTAGTLTVCGLLFHKFTYPKIQYSREKDPIIGVSFTGLFDFFVNLFGIEWLKWWMQDRANSYVLPTDYTIDLMNKLPKVISDKVKELLKVDNSKHLFKVIEQVYLTYWKDVVKEETIKYCKKHNLKQPNRFTTVQPAGTKSLLTNASPGWHPPKALWFIRRITFAAHDPVALACRDFGYNVVPAQSCRDENGNLLDDINDPRVHEWLVEIPVETPWANKLAKELKENQIDPNKFSAIAQFDFYMQVQKYYTTHNTSATIEFREHEIEPLAKAIHNAIDNDEGYISAALLARFDANETFPRLPFEPISQEVYIQLLKEVYSRRKSEDFLELLQQYDTGWKSEEGPSGCDSDKCLYEIEKST